MWWFDSSFIQRSTVVGTKVFFGSAFEMRCTHSCRIVCTIYSYDVIKNTFHDKEFMSHTMSIWSERFRYLRLWMYERVYLVYLHRIVGCACVCAQTRCFRISCNKALYILLDSLVRTDKYPQSRQQSLVIVMVVVEIIGGACFIASFKEAYWICGQTTATHWHTKMTKP